MNRVEKFRNKNRMRKIYIFSVVFLILFIIVGISCADFAVNNLLEDNGKLEFFSLNKLDNSVIVVSFFNEKLYLNPTFINRDYQKLKEEIEKMVSK